MNINMNINTNTKTYMYMNKENKPQVTMFFDGASKGNPGPGGYGYYIKSDSLNIDIKNAGYIPYTTNNYAEYSGLLAGLRHIKELTNGYSPIQIDVKGDSELVIKQMNNIYKVRNKTLQKLYGIVCSLTTDIKNAGHMINFNHIPRKDNHIADRLASSMI